MKILFSILFFRVDDDGMVADQRSVFRVNCMDCLDRTNVVQATIARVVLETLVRPSLYLQGTLQAQKSCYELQGKIL